MTILSPGSGGCCVVTLRPCYENSRILRILSTSITISFYFLSDIVMYSWGCRPDVMKTCNVSFFYRKSVMHQQDTIKKEHKVTEISVFKTTRKENSEAPPSDSEEPCSVGCCTVRLGNFLPTSRRNIPPVSSGLWVNSRTHNSEDERGTFLRNVGKEIPIHTAQLRRRPAFPLWKQVCN
jgi:hypothetical protein